MAFLCVKETSDIEFLPQMSSESVLVADSSIQDKSVFLIFWVAYCQLAEFSDIKYTLISPHLPIHSL